MKMDINIMFKAHVLIHCGDLNVLFGSAAHPNRPTPTVPPANTPEGGVNVVSEELQSFLFNMGA